MPENFAIISADTDSLAACGVSYAVGRRTLLDDVSVRIEPGKLIAVVGPNGAGKTTLLRLLSGEIAPRDGEVRLEGRPLGQGDYIERARRLAVLPQQSTFNANLTSLETTLLGRSPHQAQSSRENDQRVAGEALDAVNARHLADRLYPSLSGGEKSRVQTARVMAQIWGDPDEGSNRFLLLDEPTAALDFAHQHRLLASARHFARRRVGVFAVLHDLNLAAQYADYIVVMARGRVAAEGPPEAIFQSELLSRVFDIELLVMPHPREKWPLVIPVAQSHADMAR